MNSLQLQGLASAALAVLITWTIAMIVAHFANTQASHALFFRVFSLVTWAFVAVQMDPLKFAVSELCCFQFFLFLRASCSVFCRFPVFTRFSSCSRVFQGMALGKALARLSCTAGGRLLWWPPSTLRWSACIFMIRRSASTRTLAWSSLCWSFFGVFRIVTSLFRTDIVVRPGFENLKNEPGVNVVFREPGRHNTHTHTLRHTLRHTQAHRAVSVVGRRVCTATLQ